MYEWGLNEVLTGCHVRIKLTSGITFLATVVDQTENAVTVIGDAGNLRMTLSASEISECELTQSDEASAPAKAGEEETPQQSSPMPSINAQTGVITYFNDGYMGGYIRSDGGKDYQFNMTNVRDSATQLFFSEQEISAIRGTRVSFQPGLYEKADGTIKDIARNVRLAPADAASAQTNLGEPCNGGNQDVSLEVQKRVAAAVVRRSGQGGSVLLSELGSILKVEGISYKEQGFKKLKGFIEACSSTLSIDDDGLQQTVTAKPSDQIQPESSVTTPSEGECRQGTDQGPRATAAVRDEADNTRQYSENEAQHPASDEFSSDVCAEDEHMPSIAKLLLAPEDQIEHMKSQGIQFNIIDEASASKYLAEENNYFRVRSFRRGFKKIEEGSSEGCYVNLDFGMLVDLAEIDELFRTMMLKLTLDVEHGARLVLLEEAQNHEDDPYSLVKDFLESTNGAKTKESLDKKAEKLRSGTLADPYVKGIVERYADDANGYPLWALLELISFGSLCWLYPYVANRYGDSQMRQESYVLTVVRLLRNACAHGNCILNDVFGADHPETRVNFEVRKYIQSIQTIGTDQRDRMLNSERVYSIIATMYAHRQFASDMAYDAAREELQRLLSRMKENREYYLGNNYAIVYAYGFFEKLVSWSFGSEK